MTVTEFRYKITVDNAEQVKQKFADIQAQLKQGAITEGQAAEQTRNLARDARILNNEGKAQTQIYLAANPALRGLTQTMSIFGSTARTALSITNALNLAILATSGQSDKVAELRQQLVELDRQRLRAKTTDEEKLIDDEKLQKQRELDQAIKEQTISQITNGLTAVASGTLIVGEVVKIRSEFKTLKKDFGDIKTALSGAFSIFTDGTIKSKIGGFFGAIKGGFSELGGGSTARALGGMAAIGVGAASLATGGMDALIGKSDDLTDKLKAIGGVALIGTGIALEFPALAKIALIGTAIATATVAIIVFRKEIGGFLSWVIDTLEKGLAGSWDKIQKGFIDMLNGIIGGLNSGMSAIAGGINFVVNTIVDAINAVIGAYNALPKQLRIFGDAGLISHVNITAPTIPLIKAASGFNGTVDRTTLFMAGEAGSEHVSITPSGRGGGSGGSTIVNNFHIAGSVWSTRELLGTVDNHFKTEARRYGFNGLL